MSDVVKKEALLRVRDLRVRFAGAARAAVDGVGFDVHAGQMVALVGESGSGKSVTACSVLGLLPGSARVEGGAAQFRTRGGASVDLLGAGALRGIRGREIGMIFQEPMTSLNPVMRVGEQIAEGLILHEGLREREAMARAGACLAEVGIGDVERRLAQYPHEFSGGMRQRVMIAMALACGPSLLLADEPTTALDVTVQAQVLALIERMRRERGMGVLFITHDLGVVARYADYVCVMYGGRVVECASVFDLFDRATHPYTRALLRCVPGRERGARLSTVRDEIGERAERIGCDGGERVAWWPWHEAPAGSGGATAMVSVGAGHWVRVWGGAGVVDCEAAIPAFLRGGVGDETGGKPCAC